MRFRNHPAFFILVFLTCLSSVAAVRAQAGKAELTGEVRDQNGAVITQARVVATEVDTSQTYSSSVTDNGDFTITNIKPGTYTLAVEAAGFKRFVREGVRLATGERVRVDVALQPGAVSENVTVSQDASLLRTETGSLGQVIRNRKILDIPLNGRNFLSLVTLSAGVAQPPPTTAGPSFPRINGGRPRTNEYLFDGISVLQPEPGQVAFFPIIEAIQEFKVEVNSPSAEFGRFNGGVVNLTTKSGTNDFHGSAFEFVRNEALNARNLFAPATAANPNKPVCDSTWHQVQFLKLVRWFARGNEVSTTCGSGWVRSRSSSDNPPATARGTDLMGHVTSGRKCW